MIGFLSGYIADPVEDGIALVLHHTNAQHDTVGYDVHVTERLAAAVERDATADPVGHPDGCAVRVALTVHTHVREDALDLYGFESAAERAMFRRLLSVSNVGPRTAMALLALPVVDLARAVVGRNLKRLEKVKGIGKKTAERVCLELADILEKDLAGKVSPEVLERSGTLVNALVGLGFEDREAERAVRELGALEGTTAELVKRALRGLVS